MRQKTTWTGLHQGIGYEIVRWNYPTDPRPNWNYYIYLHLHKLPERFRKLSWPRSTPLTNSGLYDQTTPTWLHGVRFHCGVTFFAMMYGTVRNRDTRVIEVGCDYMHYWDEQHRGSYNESWLQSDAIDTIESLHYHIVNYGGLRRGTRSGFYDLDREDFRS